MRGEKTMYAEIEKRCEEIIQQLGDNPDHLEIARLSYIQALVDSGIIPVNYKTPV
jgi:hypothetical protein